MHIHWFSPLPPDRTDIARFSVSIVEELLKQHAVTLWTDRPPAPDALPKGAASRLFRTSIEVWHEINQGDAAVFNLGNHPRYHEWIWQASRAVPGIVIIHDPVLQDLFRGLAGGPGTYLALMRRFHGDSGYAAAVAHLAGRLPIYGLVEKYPLTAAALDNALAGVVHWPGAFAGGSVPVRCLPLPFPARSHPPRARPIGAGSPKRLVVFGYLGRNRRIGALLDALAGLAQRGEFHLDIYGTFEPPEDLAPMIGARKLESTVTTHGYTPPHRLDVALRDADLVINLRGPTMGEVSGTELRAWDHALPTLVSRIGWYATIPSAAAAFVEASDPRREIDDIRRHLLDFLADPADYAAMGRAGRIILENQHSLAAYAAALIELCAERPALSVGWAENYLADRVGKLTGGWADNAGLFVEAAARIVDLFEGRPTPQSSAAQERTP